MHEERDDDSDGVSDAEDYFADSRTSDAESARMGVLDDEEGEDEGEQLPQAASVFYPSPSLSIRSAGAFAPSRWVGGWSSPGAISASPLCEGSSARAESPGVCLPMDSSLES